MLQYPKYVGIPKENLGMSDAIKEHLAAIGHYDIRIINGTDDSEWSKVLATTHLTLMITWVQEVERICDEFGLDYGQVTDFFQIQRDVKRVIFPGFIGGHCLIPNVKLIKKVRQSDLLDWVEWSNSTKGERVDE